MKDMGLKSIKEVYHVVLRDDAMMLWTCQFMHEDEGRGWQHTDLHLPVGHVVDPILHVAGDPVIQLVSA